MRLVTFSRQGGAPQPGVLLQDGAVAPLSGLGFADVISVLAGGPAALARITDFVSAGPGTAAPDTVTLLAPIPRPPKLICVGLNYRDHAMETNMEIPTVPTIFNKFPNVVIAWSR